MQPLVRSSLVLLLALGAAACRSTVVGAAAASDGVEIVYTDRGAGDPPLVLVHGWSCQRTQWSDVEAELARRHRVVAVDLGGHGDSGADRDEWTLERLGGDVVAVLDELDLEGAVLVGHSMGGPVALAAASARPERVAGVIGVDTFHDAERRPEPERMQVMIEACRSDFRGFVERFVDASFGPEADPVLNERVMAGVDRMDPRVAVALMEDMAAYDLAEALRRTRVPVYAVNAETNATNVEGNRKHARWFDARFVPGVGHWVMMEAPEAFLEHLEALLTDLAGREPARIRIGAEAGAGGRR